MALSIEQSPDGTWAVLHDGAVVASGLSNAAAWREADQLDEEAGRDSASPSGTGKVPQASCRRPWRPE